MVNRRQLIKISALGTASFAAPAAYSVSEMTMSYNTGNPIGSTDPRDLSDNAKILDKFVNGPGSMYADRFGTNRKTIPAMGIEFEADQAGRNSAFTSAQAERVTEFVDFLESSGFETPVDYVVGLSITRPTQTVRYLGELYRAKNASLPFVTSGWAIDVPKLLAAGDASLRQELADPSRNDKMLAFMRGPFGKSAYTVAGMLSAQSLNVWEYINRIPAGDRIDEAEPATWYWDTAINAALQEGKKVLIPHLLKVKRKITTKVTGAQLVGDGIDSAGLVLDPQGGPGAGFIGDCVIELGDSTAAADVSTHLGISSLTIDVGGRDIPGVAMFGARDGSYVQRVYIKNFSSTAFKTNKAGGGTGFATGKMCQGVKIEQVVALPQHGIKTDVFLLDGIFESEINLCKAFGFTLAENSAVGFAVGRNTESRGVKLNTCSAANMVKFGNAANFNAVIQYGEWSRDNWDYNITFENVEGAGVVFHGGTASGQLLPLNCRSIDPRPYFSAVAAVLNPLYLFRKANACFAEGVNYYSTVKAIFEFTGEGGLNNYGVLTGGVNPEALVSSGVVVFGAGALSSNFVAGYSSEVSTRKEFVVTVDQQFYRVLPNGASEQTDQFYTTFNLGDSGKYRWRNKSLETVASIDDSGLSSGKTALSVKLIKNGVISFDRIEVGTIDSAGTGYRTLRIPN